MPPGAEGGIVTGPTLAMIGERGPEAVVPLGEGGDTCVTNEFHIDADFSTASVRIKRYGTISNQELMIQTSSMTVAIHRPISEGETSLASHLGQDSLNSRTTLLHFLQSIGDSLLGNTATTPAPNSHQ